MNYFDKDLTSLHEDLVNKKISATDLTKATFDNIDTTDADVAAFLNLNKDAAWKRLLNLMKRASMLITSWLGSPLHQGQHCYQVSDHDGCFKDAWKLQANLWRNGN